MNLTRREFCVKSTGGLLGIALGLKHNVSAQTTHELTIDLTQTANSALLTVGSAMYAVMPSTNITIIVVRISSTQVAAFSSVCTHLGCKVNLPTGGVVTCPCHGSQFTTTGIVTLGPALTNLSPYYAQLSGNYMYIDSVPTSVQDVKKSSLSKKFILKQSSFRVYTVRWTDPAIKPIDLHVHNTAGISILQVSPLANNAFEFSMTGTAPGKYIIHITTTSGEISVSEFSVK
jgi:Rieske Fe-S protein